METKIDTHLEGNLEALLEVGTSVPFDLPI